MEKKLNSEIVFQCPIFKVEQAKVELDNGTVEDRWYVLKNDAIGIIAENEKGEILLTYEFRSGSGKYSWRIPGGGLKDGESPADGAHRELREETGFDTKQLELIMEANNSTGWIKQSQFFFVAKNLFVSPLDSGEFEDIKVVPSKQSKIEELIREGEIKGNIADALRKYLDLSK